MSKFWNVFVKILKCICQHFEMYLSNCLLDCKQGQAQVCLINDLFATWHDSLSLLPAFFNQISQRDRKKNWTGFKQKFEMISLVGNIGKGGANSGILSSRNQPVTEVLFWIFTTKRVESTFIRITRMPKFTRITRFPRLAGITRITTFTRYTRIIRFTESPVLPKLPESLDSGQLVYYQSTHVFGLDLAGVLGILCF